MQNRAAICQFKKGEIDIHKESQVRLLSEDELLLASGGTKEEDNPVPVEPPTHPHRILAPLSRRVPARFRTPGISGAGSGAGSTPAQAARQIVAA